MNLQFAVNFRLPCLFIWLACCLPSTLLAQSHGDEKQYKYGIWAGVAYNSIGFESERGTGFVPVFGAEFRIKKTGMFLALRVAASHINTENYYSNLNREGVNGEMGFVFHCFPIGRLSGRMSRGYFGGEIGFGRQGFSYIDRYRTPPARYERKMSWTNVLARCGWRWSARGVFVDLALPIGLQFEKITAKENYTYDFSATNFILAPAFTVGIRF